MACRKTNSTHEKETTRKNDDRRRAFTHRLDRCGQPDAARPGQLLDGGSPANGSNDLRFVLYTVSSGGTALGTNTVSNQSVNNGIFVVSLDFGGAVFDGSDRWLEISARPGGSANPFTNTFPRQKVSAAPYAVYANNSVPPGSRWRFKKSAS